MPEIHQTLIRVGEFAEDLKWLNQENSMSLKKAERNDSILQQRNLTKRNKQFLKTQKEICELKNTFKEIKNATENMDSRIDEQKKELAQRQAI